MRHCNMYAATTVPIGKKKTQANPNSPDADTNHGGGVSERRIAIQATSAPIKPTAAPRTIRITSEETNPATNLGSPDSYNEAKSVRKSVITVLARLTTYTDWRTELPMKARGFNVSPDCRSCIELGNTVSSICDESHRPLWVSSSLSAVYHLGDWYRPEAACESGKLSDMLGLNSTPFR